MNNIVVKEWERTKHDLINNINLVINRNNVDTIVMAIMKEMLLNSKIKYNKDKLDIDN